MYFCEQNNRIMDIDIREIEIRDLRPNNGEVEGLPRNPRKISKKNLEKLKKSVQDAPEMLRLRELIVVPHGGVFVVIAGNQRLEAAKAIGMESLPCKVLPEDIDPAKLREYAIKDNLPFGEDDWEIIASEWDTAELEEWGMSVPDEWKAEDVDQDFDIGKNEEAEELLNRAMQENANEYIQQVDYLEKKGWIKSGLTLGLCKAKFISAKYYGEKYPQWIAHYFAPEMFHTPAGGNKHSIYDAVKKAGEEGKAGIAGLRTAFHDGELNISKGSYPIGDSVALLDFPSSLMLSILKRFSPDCARVLDPCHGWGGRLIGALLYDADEYIGIDPSPVAHRAVTDIYNAFGVYSKTNAKLIQEPFERVDLGDMVFDIAITSPPYFDVEKYDGEEQAHRKYPQFDAWVDGFYKPMIEKVYNHIKTGGVFVLNVGSQRYPLKDTALEIAEKCGFSIEGIEPFGGSVNSPLHAGREDRDEINECLIILRK